MNLGNKLTFSKIIIAILIIIILLFPFYQIGINFPTKPVGRVIVEFKYIVAGFLFIIAVLIDLFDKIINKNNKKLTSLDKIMTPISNKILVDSTLIILAVVGFISPIIPVVIIVRDIFVDGIKMTMGEKIGVVGSIGIAKVKIICLMVGIALTLFYNLPFELIGIKISDFLLIISTILSVISGIQYYNILKKVLKES